MKALGKILGLIFLGLLLLVVALVDAGGGLLPFLFTSAPTAVRSRT